MVTVVLALAVWPLSSDTLQVIPTGPVGAPVEEYVAVVPVPANGAGRGRVAVGQRTVLRAHADGGNRAASHPA